MKDFAVLRDLDQIKSLAHPDRLRVLRLLAERPKTGAQLAAEMGAPANRVHYHLQQLLRLGLIEEAGTGRKRWKEERYFLAAARHFLVDPRVGVRDERTSEALRSSFETAFLDWRRRELLDVDLAQVANRVVHDSLRVRRGERVLVMCSPHTLELGEAILVELEAIGARAATKLWSRNLLLRTIDRHSERSLAELPFVDPELDERIDAVVFVSSSVPQGPPPSAEQLAKLPLVLEAVSRWHRSLLARRVRFLQVDPPHRGELSAGGSGIEEGVDLFWRSLQVDGARLRRRAERLLERVGEDSDLVVEGAGGARVRLRVDPARAHASDGVVSESDVERGRTFDELPAGSLVLLPSPGSAEGEIAAAATFVSGRHLRDVEVTLRGGRIARIRAAEDGGLLRERLERMPGDAKCLATVRIGLNPAGRAPTGKLALDACLEGVVSFGFGNNELYGGDVRSTFDLILPCTGATVRAGATELVTSGELEGEAPR